jgi:hypothetical protein
MKQLSFLPEPTTREEIAAKAKRRRGGREPIDFGLFGTEHLQTDLVEQSRRRLPDDEAQNGSG